MTSTTGDVYMPSGQGELTYSDYDESVFAGAGMP